MPPHNDIVIYHNPKCSKSRKTLELIREHQIEPVIVEYLKTPLTAAQLHQLFCSSQTDIREHLRTKAPEFKELGLDNPNLSDEQLIEAIAENPILLERPVVSTPKGTRLCRPPEAVLDLLP